jgi:hypothetical protein
MIAAPSLNSFLKFCLFNRSARYFSSWLNLSNSFTFPASPNNPLPVVSEFRKLLRSTVSITTQASGGIAL